MGYRGSKSEICPSSLQGGGAGKNLFILRNNTNSVKEQRVYGS